MEPIPYLIWLRGKSLPLAVSTPQETRLVSMLKAAGLVEATNLAPANAQGRHWPAAEAVVLCITDQGHEAIARHVAMRGSTATPQKHMPLDCLRSLEHSAFPLRVEDPNAINSIAVLMAAGFVEATLSGAPACGDAQECSNQALVLRITELGRAALERNRR
jgi:hypothetical protein